MAWIEFHASKVKKLNKFHRLRKEMGWSVIECLGFLGLLWGEVIEVCESGDVTGWSTDYIAEITGLNDSVALRVWEALNTYGWIDTGSNGVKLIHDWLDYAGLFLTRKYSSSDRDFLVKIWALHGRVYGNPSYCNSKRTVSEHTLPNLTIKRYGHSDSLSRGEKEQKNPTPVPKTPPQMESFERFWKAYPRKVAKPAAQKAFSKVSGEIEQILTGLELAKKTNALNWAKENGAYIPHPATWLNQRRWEDELANGTPKPNYWSTVKLHPYASQPVRDSSADRACGRPSEDGITVDGIRSEG